MIYFTVAIWVFLIWLTLMKIFFKLEEIFKHMKQQTNAAKEGKQS